MRKVLALVLALLAVALPIACGSGDSASEVLTPEDVAAAAARTAEVESYRTSFEGTIQAAGESVEMSGEGEFASEGKRGSMTMNMSVQGQDLTMDMVIAWPAFYMRFTPELRADLPAGKEWVKFDIQKLGKEFGVDFNELMQASQSDPTQALEYLRRVSDLKTLGQEDVRGVETTHFRGEVDLKRVAAEAPPATRDSVERVLELSGLDRLPTEVWVSSDGLVRRMKYTYADMRSPGAPPIDMTMQMELYDFGVAVDVTEPPADQVVDLQELMRQGAPPS
jgi:hypothetical protein